MSIDTIRNIAIVAHVDHGKTTLVDGLLKQTQTFEAHESEMQEELIMDSGDQEKERGITITAKITAVYHDDHKINIIDTPGHADFGGEVERTLNMADGCLLIVDAQEGPMPQTKFVLKKAFESGLKPIVIINKIDKPDANISRVEDELSDLFLELATDEAHLDYITLYAIGRDGKAWTEVPDNQNSSGNLEPVFTAIINNVPSPIEANGTGLQMLVTALDWDSYLGKYAIGKIRRGKVSKSQSVTVTDSSGQESSGRIDKVFIYEGLKRKEIESASAGEIVAVTGLSDVKISQTIASADNPEALPEISLESPTLTMYLGPNTSPFKGQEGEYTTSRQISDRLDKELETNIGLKVEQRDSGFILKGRGELHLSVLIETMRREGYEFEVGRPQVITKEEDGKKLEPYEEVTLEVPTEFTGTVQSIFGKRKAQLIEQVPLDTGNTKLVYEIPTRALLGMRSILITETKGNAVFNTLMSGFKAVGQPIDQQRNGVMIAYEQGVATAYALQNAEARGTNFIKPGTRVYAGQVVGLNSRGEDIEINVTKAKQLTNMRSKSSDGTTQLTPPTILSLEQSIDFLEKDELLEVTPESLRIRKRELDKNKRKKQN